MAARQVLELRKVDVMEEAVFIDRISTAAIEIYKNSIEGNILQICILYIGK